jgi:hypothetical protein
MFIYYEFLSKRPYRVYEKISPFPAPREEWKEETKEETKRGQRGGAGFSFLGAGYCP